MKIRYCAVCNKVLTRRQKYFCCPKCFYAKNGTAKYKKCMHCKQLFRVRAKEKSRKFCCTKCYNAYFKKNKLGWYNSKIQSKLGKKGGLIGGPIGGKKVALLYSHLARERGLKAAVTNRKNNTGVFGISNKMRVINGKLGGAATVRNNPGLYKRIGKIGGKIGSKISIAKHLKNNTGWQNPELNRIARENILIQRKKLYVFKNTNFDSNFECEIAMNLYYQFNTHLKFRKTVHFLVGRKEFDFFIEKFKVFIEYHVWDYRYKLDIKKYTKDRQKILDEGGYKDYNLLVIS